MEVDKMSTREEKRRNSFVSLLAKAEEANVSDLTKSDVDKMLVNAFNTNAEIYDKFQDKLDYIYSMDGDLDRYVKGDTRTEAELVNAAENEARTNIKKTLFYIVKWGVTSGFYSNAREIVDTLYNADGVRHISARTEYRYFCSGCEISEEEEQALFTERFLKVTGFACRMHDFKNLMA